MIIAIDGPAASGKGTLARRLARRYGLIYLDTGALYRAVATLLLNDGADLSDAEAAVAATARITPAFLEDSSLRTAEAGRAASVVAAMPPVRTALFDYQRSVATTPPGAVLDGRDIGTVICPDAEVKLFVTADLTTRAERRYHELMANGMDTSRDIVLKDLAERDQRDAQRAEAPLVAAEDAYLLDTSNLDIEAAFQAACAHVDAATGIN